MSASNKAEIREEMRAIYESVMILGATSRIAHDQAFADHSKKAEGLKLMDECLCETKALRAQYDSLKAIHDALE